MFEEQILFLSWILDLGIRYILRSHHEGIFIEEQADKRAYNCNRQCNCAECKEQYQRNDMSQCDATPPIVIMEAPVGHLTMSEQCHFRCEGVKFTSQCEKQIDRDTGREECHEKCMQVSWERDQQIHDQEYATGNHHGLCNKLERKQTVLPHITSFRLTQKEGSVDHNSQCKWENNPRCDETDASHKFSGQPSQVS